MIECPCPNCPSPTDCTWWNEMALNQDSLLATLHIIGIPATDLADIYKVVQEWRMKGGNDRLLEMYSELFELREKVARAGLDA